MRLSVSGARRGMVKAAFVVIAVLGGFAVAMMMEIEDPTQADVGLEQVSQT